MNDGKSEFRTGGGNPGRPTNLRLVSNQILERANSGIPRAQFFKEVSQMLAAFTGCDIIRFVLKERNRRYRCEHTGEADRPFRFEVTPNSLASSYELAWTSDVNGALERICRDIVHRRVDPAAPWFTRNGSFWTGDVDSLPIAGLRDPDKDSRLAVRIDVGYQAQALIPIEAGHEPIGLLQLEFKQTRPTFDQEVETYERLVHILGVALVHRRLQVALRERVKELTCLYAIAKLVARPDLSLGEVLQRTAELLPPAWLHPGDCCARIVLDDQFFSTRGFRKPTQSMKADIIANGEKRGYVEVGYVWEKPELDEGPFLKEERSLIDAIADDISTIVEQVQAEEEKSLLQEQLRHADRLATTGQLAAGLAHELNEPLANILGFAQLAAKDQSLSSQTRQDVEKIIAASLHARDVTAKLLVFARETTPEKRPLNLNGVVEDALYFLQSRCDKSGILLKRSLGEELPTIMADRSQLLQVLTNLVVNSIQAMPRGGQLMIGTAATSSDVLLTVADTGTGISQEIMGQIFNPFFTTKDVDQGTGLGLSIVHGIVTSHGGTIGVESKVDCGTKFEVRFPIQGSTNSEENGDGKS